MKNELICFFKFMYYSLHDYIVLRIGRYKWNKHDKKKGYFWDRFNPESPLFTVYTPTYNRAKLLIERTIPSVLKQKCITNFEYLIIGDGCTDDTEHLLNELQVKKDIRIRFYNLPQRDEYVYYSDSKYWKQSGSRPANFAYKMAKGKYIARIDDDDEWTEFHLIDSYMELIKKKVEFMTSDYIIPNDIEKGGQIGSYYFHPNGSKKKLGVHTGCHSSWVFKNYLKHFKYNLDCWRKKWNAVSDTDLLMRFKRAGVRMGHLDKPNVLVLPRPNENDIGFKAFKIKMEEQDNA